MSLAASLRVLTSIVALSLGFPLGAQRVVRPGDARQYADPRTGPTEKPALHARHWLAITGKPLSATAGAQIFAKGGNAIDAAAGYTDLYADGP